MKNILVTGAAGFIGYSLTKQLLLRGDVVTGLDNINSYYDVELKYARLKELGIERNAICEGAVTQSKRYPAFRFAKIDLQQKEAVDRLIAEGHFDVVCNLAAQAGVRYSIDHPFEYINSNIVGFMDVLEACRQYNVGHFVYASSSSVYGNDNEVPYSEKDEVDHPVSLYAATKKSDELLAYSYSRLYGLPATGVRFFTVYGPWGRPDMAPYLFMNAVLSDKPIRVFNHGGMAGFSILYNVNSRFFTLLKSYLFFILLFVVQKPLFMDNRMPISFFSFRISILGLISIIIGSSLVFDFSLITSSAYVRQRCPWQARGSALSVVFSRLIYLIFLWNSLIFNSTFGL